MDSIFRRTDIEQYFLFGSARKWYAVNICALNQNTRSQALRNKQPGEHVFYDSPPKAGFESNGEIA
jgi:hypothetical protein